MLLPPPLPLKTFNYTGICPASAVMIPCFQPCRLCIPVPALGLSWRHCWGHSGGPTAPPPPCPAPALGCYNFSQNHKGFLLPWVPASPKTPKQVDFCRQPLLRNRTIIPGMLPKCVSPTGETCSRAPGRVHSHGDTSRFLLHVFGASEERIPCVAFPACSPGNQHLLIAVNLEEGRSAHFLITCETTAAPKEQKWEGVRSRR